MKKILLSFLLLAAISVSAQETETGAAPDVSDSNSVSEAPNIPPPKTPPPMRVIGYDLLYKDAEHHFLPQLADHAELGDYIAVKVQGLDSLREMEAKSQGASYITLYFNNIPMNLYPLFPTSGNDELVFRIIRDTLSETAWDVFYDYPRKYVEEIPLTVGLDNGFRIPTDVKKFKMAIVDRPMLFLNIVLLLLMSIVFVYLTMRTPMLRGSNRPGAPYSLARVQLAFWTIIIMFSFVCIYTITGDLPELRTSSLVLLGISMGTTAAARVIDSPSTVVITPSDEKSKGLLYDIISDGTGVSIHRLQMVGWTVIMGFYFIRQAHLYLNIPEINDTMLMLMGISSATYVGLKVPENRSNSGNTNPPAQTEQPQNNPPQNNPPQTENTTTNNSAEENPEV